MDGVPTKKEKAKAYYQINKERFSQKHQENKEVANEKSKAWYQAHYEKAIA